jgi:hypothetical protein
MSQVSAIAAEESQASIIKRKVVELVKVPIEAWIVNKIHYDPACDRRRSASLSRLKNRRVVRVHGSLHLGCTGLV